jgi:general secretion pathway protein A
MYQSFYGLRERPFDLTSDLKYLLLTPKHQEALAHLEYGLAAGTGLTLLIGEAGTGKSTLLRKVLAARMSGEQSHVVFVTNPALSRGEFFDRLAGSFGLSAAAGRSKTRFLRELEHELLANQGKETTRALVIDEAQSLSDELLEEVRLLANLESETEKLLRVVLAGQPALAARLNEPAFSQLKQRVGLRCRLDPLDLNETAEYIVHRIAIAGGTPGRAFSRGAVMAIHEHSGGILRTINVICENALLTGFGAGKRPIGPDIVAEVCTDLDLRQHQAGSRPGSLAAVQSEQPFESSRTGRAQYGAQPDRAVGPRPALFPRHRWGGR